MSAPFSTSTGEGGKNVATLYAARANCVLAFEFSHLFNEPMGTSARCLRLCISVETKRPHLREQTERVCAVEESNLRPTD